MSQILAIFHLDGSPVQPKDLETAARSLSQVTKSPHTPRLWRDTEGPSTIGLIHLRQVFTTEDLLDKPWSNGHSNSTIIADARLDNRLELSQQLHIPQTNLKHLPDSAIILAAYQRWGNDCPQHLTGEFTFAVWDPKKQQLFCSRDPLGNRSLFWFKDAKRVVVSSTLGALFSMPEIGRTLNRKALAEHLTFSGRLDGTLYQGVSRLPAGHTLTCAVDKFSTRRYWNPAPKALSVLTDEECIEAFTDLLSTAVECRLRTPGKVGIFMSGGLDSTSVAATAAPFLAARNKQLSVFSSLPPKDFRVPEGIPSPLPERALIEAIADLFPNLQLQVINDRESNALENLEQSFHYSDAPFVANANRSWFEAGLSQAAAQDISVVLTGAAGNATISYDGHTRLMDLLRRGHWLSLGHELRALAATSGLSVRRLAINHLLAPLLPNQAMNSLARLGLSARKAWTYHSPVSPDAIASFSLNPTHLTANWNRKTASATWRASYFSNPLYEDALDNVNSWRHQFGVDLRDPTADQRVVEFCLALPDQHFLRDGQNRSLIRRAMKGKLPAELLNETRHGQLSQDWFVKFAPMREEFKMELQRMRHSEAACEILDLPRLEALVNNWPTGNWFSPDVSSQYKFVLQRAIAAGRFIRWVERKES